MHEIQAKSYLSVEENDNYNMIAINFQRGMETHTLWRRIPRSDRLKEQSILEKIIAKNKRGIRKEKILDEKERC